MIRRGLRVLVCGGRNYDDQKRVWRALRALNEGEGIACVVQGGARGADSLGRVWAERQGIPVFECRANWTRYGKKAGPTRNEWMLVHFRPDVVMAFPGGTGTAHMRRAAEEAGVRVWEPYPRDSGRLPQGEDAERSGAAECEASQSGAAKQQSPKLPHPTTDKP